MFLLDKYTGNLCYLIKKKPRVFQYLMRKDKKYQNKPATVIYPSVSSKVTTW